ncbi:MAG: hypothetical protein OXL37_11850 [Chloroflexota bacterium]|nr:hypothetical protein [Chloroflexota bacterium]MDE2962134.1 hypothetical protein [Chloroflexota bacterium]
MTCIYVVADAPSQQWVIEVRVWLNQPAAAVEPPTPTRAPVVVPGDADTDELDEVIASLEAALAELYALRDARQ